MAPPKGNRHGKKTKEPVEVEDVQEQPPKQPPPKPAPQNFWIRVPSREVLKCTRQMDDYNISLHPQRMAVLLERVAAGEFDRKTEDAANKRMAEMEKEIRELKKARGEGKSTDPQDD